jgi:broad specificity phosphatase PhoE
MVNRLYWVRHGENVANLTKEFSSRYVDYSLTPKGVLQAQQTGEYFRDKDIHALYSSPLKRATETATIIGAAIGLPVTVLENFREIDVGELELQPPTAEAWAFHDRIFHAWLRGDRDAGFAGGDDYHKLWARMLAGFERIVDGAEDRNLLVVGHGGNLAAILKDLVPGLDLKLLRGGSHNCAITELGFERRDGRLQAELVSWAAHGHMHGEAAQFVTGLPETSTFAGQIVQR